jgi:hypothetical protein
MERTDLFEISNLVLGGKETVTSLYSSLEGWTEWERDRDRERESEWERERRPVRREKIMLVTIREQRYVSETKKTI